jgi:hypothetical protein
LPRAIIFENAPEKTEKLGRVLSPQADLSRVYTGGIPRGVVKGDQTRSGHKAGVYHAELPSCIPTLVVAPQLQALSVLAAVHDRHRSGFRGDRSRFAGSLDLVTNLLGATQRLADIAILRGRIKRDQPIAVRAIGLEVGADSLCSLAEDLRALRAFDSDFVVDHDRPSKELEASNMHGRL